jgi:hypothetical protein
VWGAACRAHKSLVLLLPDAVQAVYMYMTLVMKRVLKYFLKKEDSLLAESSLRYLD